MIEATAVDGSLLAPESIRMMEYLKTRAGELTASAICSRVRASAQELEDHVAAVPKDKVRWRPAAGKWSIAEVVDHISQTQARGTEELRHLLAGRRLFRPSTKPCDRARANGLPGNCWLTNCTRSIKP